MSSAHRRNYHLLLAGATRADTHHMKCGPGGHPHLSFTELYGAVDRATAARQIGLLGAAYTGHRDSLLARGDIEWLCFPGVLRIVEPAYSTKATQITIRGLSCRVGPYLAQKLRQRTGWAEVFLADMYHRPHLDVSGEAVA
jgi:hypothetical protein